MSLQDSHTQPEVKPDSHLIFLNKMVRVAEMAALFIMFIPMIFLGTQRFVFAGCAVLSLAVIIYLLQVKHIPADNFLLRLLVIMSLGLGLGAIQLDPIATICIALLAIMSILSLKLAEQLVLSLLFFAFVMLSYFVVKSSITTDPLINNIFINITAVIGLFFALAVRIFSEQYRYKILSSSFKSSKNRFEHFMKVSNKLARYAPSQVWQKIIQDEKDVVVENKRRKLTVFFSDIKGFTDLSESMSAEDLAFFLNNYFESMSAIAKKHGATIDKFIGDALMVFFGDPDSEGEREDALACVEMAMDMTRELARLRNYWIALGFDGLHVRMGINTGYCHVGNFGSANRLTYTAVGREVNLAARIQTAARPDTVLISDATHELIKHNFMCEKGAPIRLKGITDPVQVWEVRRLRQGHEIKEARWIEHDMPGFNLHLNMLHIKQFDKAQIRQALMQANRVLDESIKKDNNETI